MKTACMMIKDQPHYRADAFRLGLRRCGYATETWGRADLLVMWNRYGWHDDAAKEAEQRGAKVIVVENGYLGNDFAGDRYYALSRNHHNGAGMWPNLGHERWDSLGIELPPKQPVALPGGIVKPSVLVLPQRGIGPAGVAMPKGWTERVCADLNRQKAKHRVRQHPGKQPTVKDLVEDLAGITCVRTWGSGAALKAIFHGYYCVHDFPQWIGAPASLFSGGGRVPDWDNGDRLNMFRRLAWAQWRVSEIESGEAITSLVELK